MHSQIIAALARIATLLSEEGYAHESDRISRMCGVATVAEIAAEVEYIAGGVPPVMWIVEKRLTDSKRIVNIKCEGQAYTWEVKE